MHDNELSSTSRSSSPDTPADEGGSGAGLFSLHPSSGPWPLSPLTRVKPQPPTVTWATAADPFKQETDLDILFSEVIHDDVLLDNQASATTPFAATTIPAQPSTDNQGHSSVSQSQSSQQPSVPSSTVCPQQSLNANGRYPTLPARVVFPLRESCIELPIVFPNIPEAGTKSRVETQIKLTLDLAYGDINPENLFKKHYYTVGSWNCLKLPEGTSTRRRPRKDPKIEVAPEETLYLDATVTCASEPHVRVAACLSCQNREAKRTARKIAARVRPSRSDEEEQASRPPYVQSESNGNQSGNGIIEFNCTKSVDFSDGSVTLPFRITCYCRHHREKMGFRVTFVMRDHKGTVVGSGTTPSIMITDDHKTNCKSAPLHEGGLDEGKLKTSSQRGQNSYAHSTRKRKNKPYDGARSATSRSSPTHSKESTPLSQTVPSTPSFELIHDPLEEINTQSSSNPIESLTALPQFMNVDTSAAVPPGQQDSLLSNPFTFFSLPSERLITPVPKIQRLIPSSGPIHGGVEITILGSGFRSDIRLSVLFGGQPSTFTQRWSDNALVCLLPAAPSPGTVAVTFETYENEPNEVNLFTYIDDNERALMELALQVVGLKMTGRIENAKDVAMRIVGSGQDNTFNTAPIDAASIMHLTSALGSVLGLEESILNLLTIFDLPSQYGISASKALSLCSSSLQNLLHLAIQSRSYMLAEALLSRGIDASARDRNGFTPMHFAALVGWQDAVNLLRRYGADIEVVDALGRSPADFEQTDSPRQTARTRVTTHLESSDDGEDADVEDESEFVGATPVKARAGCTFTKSRPTTPGSVEPSSSACGLEKDTATAFSDAKVDTKKAPVVSSAMLYNWLREGLVALQAGTAFPKGLPQIPQMHNAYANAKNLAKLSHLPELPRLPQLPAVFPVYIPIPWPAFSKKEVSSKNDTILHEPLDSATANAEVISLWKAAWEKWFAQMPQNSSRDPELHDPPPEYSAEAIEGQAQQMEEVKLRRRPVHLSQSKPVLEVTEEARSFKYRSSKVESRKSRGKRDKMLFWFWLPALLVGLIWVMTISFGSLSNLLREGNWTWHA